MAVPQTAAILMRGQARSYRMLHWASKTVSLARSKPLGAAGLAVAILMIIAAVFAPALAPYDPAETHRTALLRAPGAQFLFGTDHLGRDVFSRIVWGARVSLYVGMVSVFTGTLVGSLLGLVSGYLGGRVDFILQRIMDVLMAFPLLILAMVLVAILGSSTFNVVVALAVVLTPTANRVVRSSVLSEKENVYTEAARAIGCTAPRIIFRHMLPNVMAPIIVLLTVNLGLAILVEASLSFLGLGPPPPTPTWGAMLSGEGRSYFEEAPWLAFFPGAAISLTVLGFNLLGDALRDMWDPRLRGAGS